jgi:NAD(P)-dependent dehydrogenase (short-subunit alcohol dehydrogenase family)
LRGNSKAPALFLERGAIVSVQDETEPFMQKDADHTAKVHRDIQRGVDAKDKANGKSNRKENAMQAGARRYPVPPMPAQHLKKPGEEADLDLAPMYDAPFWKGSGKLESKVAVITGGDSGIGRAVAVLYAREGADVAIVYLNEHEDAEKTKRAVETEGAKCLLFPGDVTDRQFCFDTADRIAKEFGRLDILVNNAAFQIHTVEFEDLTEKQMDTTLKTNLYGYFHMAQACVPHMKNGAAIVNCGSVTGIEGNKDLIDYAMTKGGVHAFTRSLAGHLIPKGIRVNCVAPGPVWTPLNPADKPAEKVAEFGKHAKMKRPAQPEEIAPAFVFLASPQMSSYITGEILPVIGGY